MSQSPSFRQSVTDPVPQDESGGLAERAKAAQDAQASELEAPSLASQYGAAFAALLEAKHDQVERIEDRLEALVELEASHLQQTRAKQPGILSRQGTRERWQRQVLQHQSTMQRLQGRLEAVREIKEGMGLHSPRIEELAARKVRHQDPDLATGWHDMQEATRRHQAVVRAREFEKQKEEEKNRRARAGGHSISLSAYDAR